jgi:hypothetical protein
VYLTGGFLGFDVFGLAGCFVAVVCGFCCLIFFGLEMTKVKILLVIIIIIIFSLGRRGYWVRRICGITLLGWLKYSKTKPQPLQTEHS